jgi:hypothetical protein
MMLKKRDGNLVAWEVVMQPKEKGGLGVLNLRLQNDALLMKHLSKFYNHANIPWVQLIWSKYYFIKVPHAAREVGSFWWKDILRLNVIFRNVSNCVLGNGASVCFWMTFGQIQFLHRHTQDLPLLLEIEMLQ